LLVLLMHSIVSIPQLHCSDAVISAAGYLAATMLLTPLVTILGARRPGILAWHWFVVLPMVLVLQWPAISQLSGNHWRAPVELSGPSMMGMIVVLIMSAGTLLGTSSTLFAMLYSSGITILLMSVTSLPWGKTVVTPLSAMLVLTALWTARRNLLNSLHQIQTSETTSQRTQAVWNLFSSLHGFAWMRRVQDRINQFAPRERWIVQLTPSGFHCSNAAAGREPHDDELILPLDAFIWVLARFADETWLRQTLQNPQNLTIPHDDPSITTD
jgi:hypothetical protein